MGLILLLLSSDDVHASTFSVKYNLNSMHPIHISVTQIDHKASEKSLQITIKVFSDDFEKSLLTHSRLSKLPENQEELILGYFKNALIIKVNGKAMNYRWVGYETETDAHFVFLEIERVAKVKSLGISNEILYNLYNDQANIVHFQSEELRKSELFQVGDGEKTMEF